MKIFWSWQSDTPLKLNKNFVKEALNLALASVSKELGLSEAERPELDHDTQGEPGLVSIVDTIFKKIEEATVFVGDVTYIGTSESGKRLPNPNVMIELGHAITSIGTEGIILVANSAYGSKPEDLPFDLRHRRGPITYELREGVKKEDRIKVLEQLSNDLKVALQLNLGIAIAKKDDEVYFNLHPSQQDDRATWLGKGEKIVHHDFFNDGGESEWDVIEGTRSYIRIIPATWNSELTRLNVQEVSNRFPIYALGPWRNGDGGANNLGIVAVGIGADNKAIGVTQWFELSGEIWGFSSAAAFERDGKNYIATISILKEWMKFLDMSLAFLDHFQATAPFLIEAGVTNLRNVNLRTGQYSVLALNDEASFSSISRDWDKQQRLMFVTSVYNKLCKAFNQPVVTSEDVQRLLIS